MLSQKAKDLFAKLDMEYQPIAIKCHYCQPKGIDHVDEVMPMCAFPEKAGREDRRFYATVDDDNCFGKLIFGMVDEDSLAASGQAGMDFGVYKTQAPNAVLYHNLSKLKRGAANYIEFCPVHLCDFDPDLILCVAEIEKADILMRAASYINGDIWESKSTCVLGCNWMFGYPYVSGKINHFVTGMGHGMRRIGQYPAGRMVISIPFGRIDQVVTGLDEMRWDLICMSEDPADQAEFKRRTDAWQEMNPGFELQ